MKIEKNWFYKLSDLFLKKQQENNKLKISDNLVVSIFDDINININIYVWEKTRLEFFWLSKKWQDCNITFIQNNILSNVIVKYLILPNKNEKLKLKIFSKINSSNTKSYLNILSIIWDNWIVDLDWIIKINKNINNVEANLIEENIFIWNNWKIKWVPTLLVSSNNVKASHSCKIERINDEKLFYLRSRWLSKKNAINHILESYICSMFTCLEMFDKKFYNNLYKNILFKIQE
jgi:hypothetical protein